MASVVLKSLMSEVEAFLKSPTGRVMIRQFAKMLPYYLRDLRLSFQQTYTKITEVSSEGKTVIEKIEKNFVVNNPNDSSVFQAENMKIVVKNNIFIININSVEDYKEVNKSLEDLIKRMDKVDIENIKNEDVQIEVNNCISTSEELLKKVGSLIEKRSCN